MVSDLGKVYEIAEPVADPVAKQRLELDKYNVRQAALGNMHALVVTITGEVGYNTPLKSGWQSGWHCIVVL